MKVGVLGANGFLGSKMVDMLSGEYLVFPITRDNYSQHKGNSFDVFINMAGNNKNYWANQFPQEDFKGSALLVYNNLFDFKINQYIFISSIAVYDEKSHYGFNKAIAEEIIKRHSTNYLIFRCCATTDKDMKIGIISDILKGVPLFISSDSQIQFITRNAMVNIIKDLMFTDIKNKVFNTGGIGTIRIGDIESLTGRPVVYQPEAQKRHYEMDTSALESVVKLKTSCDYVKDIILE